MTMTLNRKPASNKGYAAICKARADHFEGEKEAPACCCFRMR